MIDNESDATRLARALLSDVWLYHETEIKEASDIRNALAGALHEARALFVARVIPELASVFDVQLAEWLAKAHQPVEPGTDPMPPLPAAPPPAMPSEPLAYAHPPVSRCEQLDRADPALHDASGSTLIIAVLLVLVVALAGALVFVLHG